MHGCCYILCNPVIYMVNNLKSFLCVCTLAHNWKATLYDTITRFLVTICLCSYLRGINVTQMFFLLLNALFLLDWKNVFYSTWLSLNAICTHNGYLKSLKVNSLKLNHCVSLYMLSKKYNISMDTIYSGTWWYSSFVTHYKCTFY